MAPKTRTAALGNLRRSARHRQEPALASSRRSAAETPGPRAGAARSSPVDRPSATASQLSESSPDPADAQAADADSNDGLAEEANTRSATEDSVAVDGTVDHVAQAIHYAGRMSITALKLWTNTRRPGQRFRTISLAPVRAAMTRLQQHFDKLISEALTDISFDASRAMLQIIGMTQKLLLLLGTRRHVVENAEHLLRLARLTHTFTIHEFKVNEALAAILWSPHVVEDMEVVMDGLRADGRRLTDYRAKLTKEIIKRETAMWHDHSLKYVLAYHDKTRMPSPLKSDDIYAALSELRKCEEVIGTGKETDIHFLQSAITHLNRLRAFAKPHLKDRMKLAHRTRLLILALAHFVVSCDEGRATIDGSGHLAEKYKYIIAESCMIDEPIEGARYSSQFGDESDEQMDGDLAEGHLTANTNQDDSDTEMSEDTDEHTDHREPSDNNSSPAPSAVSDESTVNDGSTEDCIVLNTGEYTPVVSAPKRSARPPNVSKQAPIARPRNATKQTTRKTLAAAQSQRQQAQRARTRSQKVDHVEIPRNSRI